MRLLLVVGVVSLGGCVWNNPRCPVEWRDAVITQRRTETATFKTKRSAEDFLSRYFPNVGSRVSVSLPAPTRRPNPEVLGYLVEYPHQRKERDYRVTVYFRNPDDPEIVSRKAALDKILRPLEGNSPDIVLAIRSNSIKIRELLPFLSLGERVRAIEWLDAHRLNDDPMPAYATRAYPGPEKDSGAEPRENAD